MPPISMTRAPAVRNRGVQPGSVEGATRISPGSSLAPAGERITRAVPEATPGEAGEPRSPSPTDTSAASASVPSDRSRRGMRRRIPRLLLSDGTDAEAALVSVGEGLRGSPASPGVASGTARVIRSPAGARLEPGEILVVPSTDPGWTPLFLTAGALVMEMGGMMSHGAVVAREYGIPAVVGVAGATEQITTGQRVTVDGSAGTVVLEVGPKEEEAQPVLTSTTKSGASPQPEPGATLA